MSDELPDRIIVGEVPTDGRDWWVDAKDCGPEGGDLYLASTPAREHAEELLVIARFLENSFPEEGPVAVLCSEMTIKWVRDLLARTAEPEGEPAIPDPALPCALCGEHRFTMYCDTLHNAYADVPHCERCHIEHDPQHEAVCTPTEPEGGDDE